MLDLIKIYLQSDGVPLLSKFPASNTVIFSSIVYCRHDVKMGRGEGMNEERWERGGRVVVCMGLNWACVPTPSGCCATPNIPLTAGTSEPRPGKGFN